VLIKNPKAAAANLLKATVFIFVIWYCYRLLSSNDALKDFKMLIRAADLQAVGFSLVAVFLLMIGNWLFETIKWRYICRRFEPIRFRRAVESVLCGLSWAVFTPNRIGEYGGRVMFLTPRKRVFGVIGMLVGALSQMVITNVLGAIAICWFVGTFLEPDPFLFLGICLLGLVYIAVFILLYFNIRIINVFLLKFRFLHRYKRFVDLLLRYDRKALWRVFLYSAMRYLIFTSQYCILMQTMIPDLPLVQMVLMIFILFFVQSALPSLDLFDVGVRSVTASYFFGFITPHVVAVMAVVACVWFVNLILPALIGSVFVFKINFFGSRNS